MPELPEVENLCLSLRPHLTDHHIAAVRIHRSDIIDFTHADPRQTASSMLLRGQTIARILRYGKKLALVAENGAAISIGLGMTGQLWYIPPHQRLPCRGHIHITWRIKGRTNNPTGRLIFRDVRRFGRIRAFDSVAAMQSIEWSQLGPDALNSPAESLISRLQRTRSPIKAALLDQRLVAGIGNIYADESLFHARIHPLTPAANLPRERFNQLVRSIFTTLRQAVDNGGTTLRDFNDADEAPGRNQHYLAVYGRAGKKCLICGTPLRVIRIRQRSTTFCPHCQTQNHDTL